MLQRVLAERAFKQFGHGGRSSVGSSVGTASEHGSYAALRSGRLRSRA